MDLLWQGISISTWVIEATWDLQAFQSPVAYQARPATMPSPGDGPFQLQKEVLLRKTVSPVKRSKSAIRFHLFWIKLQVLIWCEELLLYGNDTNALVSANNFYNSSCNLRIWDISYILLCVGTELQIKKGWWICKFQATKPWDNLWEKKY